jgi:hypothetical protein
MNAAFPLNSARMTHPQLFTVHDGLSDAISLAWPDRSVAAIHQSDYMRTARETGRTSSIVDIYVRDSSYNIPGPGFARDRIEVRTGGVAACAVPQWQ